MGQRGIGAISYATVAALTLPAENIANSIYLLTIFEFVFGMVLPTLRTAVLSGNISIEEAGFCSILVSLFSFLASIYFWNRGSSQYLLIISLIIFPLLIQKLVYIENHDISKSLNIDAKSAMIGALASSCALTIFYILKISEWISSPLIRGFFVICSQLIYLRNIPTKKVLFSDVNKIKIILKIIPGLDYLTIASILKAKALSNLNIANGEYAVKIIVLIYDPIAALMGYFLRSRYKQSNFQLNHYFSKTFLLFTTMLSTSIAASIASLIHSSYVQIANNIAIACLLLTIAGLTSHATLLDFKNRMYLIFSISISSLFFALEINIGYSVLITSISIFAFIQWYKKRVLMNK